LTVRLQREIYALKEAVFAERAEAARGGKPVELLFAYLSDVSDAHPNWQAEYAVLKKFIPMCF